MITASHIKNALDSAKDKAKYDENVKNILSDKYLLAWVLKYSATEYKDCSIEEIYSCIEGMPQVGNIFIEPGSTQLDKVLGLNTESNVPNEGKVTFDIIFYATHPKTHERTMIFINVEAQKEGNPGYDLVPRGVFYCARMISMQLDTVMSTEDYAVKKVYSIWISMEEGKNANTIRSYEIYPQDIFGNYRGRENYDLLSVVMIRLPKNEDASLGNELHKLLTTAFSSKMTPAQKEDIIENTYGIPMSYELKEATTRMCNLSDLVEERGINKGIALKLVQQVIKKIRKNLTISEIADQLEESEEKITEIVSIARKYAPEYDEKKIFEAYMKVAIE